MRPATATSPLRLASIFEFMHKTKASCQNLLKLSNPNNLCVKKAAIFSFSWQSFLNHFNFSIINFCLKQGTVQNTFGILNDILQDNFLNLYAFLFFIFSLCYYTYSNINSVFRGLKNKNHQFFWRKRPLFGAISPIIIV